MGEQQRPRQWIVQLEHQGAVQSQQRQRQPVLLADCSEGALYRGGCCRFGIHCQLSAFGESLPHAMRISGTPERAD